MQYVPSSSGETLSIYSPNDESLVTDKVQVASEADIDKAVSAAKAAFPKWRDTAGAKRAAIMLKFADLLEKNVDKLASLESRAMGQPISLARRFVLGPAALWRCTCTLTASIVVSHILTPFDGCRLRRLRRQSRWRVLSTRRGWYVQDRAV